MTPDDLEALVLDPQDFWPLQRALAPLTEKERAKLSPYARALLSQLRANKPADNASDRLKAFLANRDGKGWDFWLADVSRCAVMAVFGLGPVSALKKGGMFVFHQEEAVLERIIEDRRPGWLDNWVLHHLESTFTQMNFAALRRWIKAGLCQKPEVDGYYRLFAIHLMRTPRHNSDEIVPPLSRQLLDDPDLLADIDGLFRVETLAFNTNGWLTSHAPENYETWPDALVKLSDQGHLDRGHLLAQALSGLRLDIKQNQLSGFHNVYRRLSPTADERLRHQPDYIALLCHPVGHVVKFALEMLDALDKDGSLDTGPVLNEMPVVFTGGSKGNAAAALKLLGRVIGRKDAFETRGLGVVCDALRHANAEVQAQALTLLEKHAGRLTSAQLDGLADVQAFVAASNRQRLSALLSVRQTQSAPAPAPSSDRETDPYRVGSADISDHKVLFAEDRVVPIGSVNELIDALLHATEIVESPDEVERIIDAIGRLAGDRPHDLAARIAPLHHRLKSQMVTNKGIVPVSFGIGRGLWDLIYTWMTGRLVITPLRPERHETPVEAFMPLTAHLHWLAERVAQGRASVLLSAPTHKGGWIDPLIWVERLKQSVAGDVITSMDLRLSLLRLAPDHRHEALATLNGVPDALRRIAVFALGGDEAPQKTDRDAYAAWISAARCRAPYKDWRAEFAALNLVDEWPDSLVPAQYDWQSGHTKHQVHNQSWKSVKFDISVTGAPEEASQKPGAFLTGLAQAVGLQTATAWAELPSAALAQGIEPGNKWYSQYELSVVWLTRWLAYIWPQDPSAAHMKAVKRLVLHIDQNGSSWTPHFGFFHALFQKNRPWRDAGHLLLCIGLAARDADVKGLSVDALIEGMDGRLFDPDLFAATVTRVAAGEWLKLNRLGDSLMTAARVSHRHAEVVGNVVQKWLPAFDHRQTNAFAILEVLLEVQAVTGLALTAPAQTALGAITGSSKAAKLAQQLLKRDADSRKPN